MRSYIDRIPVAGVKARVIAKKPVEGVVIREFDLSQLPAVFRRLPIVGQFSWSLSMGGHPSASLQIIATYQTIAIVRHLFVRDRALTLFGIGFKINSYNESQGNFGLAPGGMYFCSISLGGKWESEIEKERFLDESDDAQQKYAHIRANDVRDASEGAIQLTRTQAADAILDGIDTIDKSSLLIKTPEYESAKRANDPCYRNRATFGDPDTLNPNNVFASVSRNQIIDPQCSQYVDKNELTGGTAIVGTPITPPTNIPGSTITPSTNNTSSGTSYRNPNYNSDGIKMPSNVPTASVNGANTNRNPNVAVDTIDRVRPSRPVTPTVQSLCDRGIITIPLINCPPLLLPPELTGTKGSQLQATTSFSDRPPGKTVIRLSQIFNPEATAIHGLYPDYNNPNGITAVSVNGGRLWNFVPSQLFPLSNNNGIAIYCENSYNDKNDLSNFPEDSAALPDFESVLPDFETPPPIFPEMSEGQIGYSTEYNNFQLDWNRADSAANQDTLNLIGYDPSDLAANLDIEETSACKNKPFFGVTSFDPNQYNNPSDELAAETILNNSNSDCNQSGIFAQASKKKRAAALEISRPRFVRQPMITRTIKEGSPNPSTPPGTGLLRDTGLNWDTGGLTKTYTERTTTNGFPIRSIDETWGFAYTGGQVASNTGCMVGSPGALWGRVKREVTEYHYDPSTGYALGSTTRGFQSVRFQQENPSEPETISLKASTDPADAKKMALYEPQLVPILAKQRSKIFTYNAYYQDAHKEMPPYEIFKQCNRNGSSSWGYVMQPGFVPSAFVSQESFLRRSYIRTDNPDFDPKEGGKPQYLAAGEETWNQVRHTVSPASSHAWTPPDNVSGLGLEMDWKSQSPSEDTFTSFNSRQSNSGPGFINAAFDESFTENIGRPSPASRLAATYKLEKPDNAPIQNDYEEGEREGAELPPLLSCWGSLSNTNPPVLKTHPPDRSVGLPPVTQKTNTVTRSDESWNRPNGSYDPLFPAIPTGVTVIPDKTPVPPKAKATKEYEYFICTPGHTFNDPIGGSISFPTAANLSQALLGAATLLKIGDIQGTLSTRIRIPFNSVIRPLDKIKFKLGGTTYNRIVKSVSCTINFKGLVDGALKIEWEPTDLDIGIDRTIPIFPVAKEIVTFDPEEVLSNDGFTDPDNSTTSDDLPADGTGYGADDKQPGTPDEDPLLMVFVSQIIRGLGEDVEFTTNRIF